MYITVNVYLLSYFCIDRVYVASTAHACMTTSNSAVYCVERAAIQCAWNRRRGRARRCLDKFTPQSHIVLSPSVCKQHSLYYLDTQSIVLRLINIF